ncbi:MAG TPA: hypothetical protein VGR91_05400 [Stellaceae bacterium]|nr:hypothetical protein [Stellaceae bacterium]
MRKTASTLAAALVVLCGLPGFALAMGATGGEMLGTTAAGVWGYGGGNPKVSPPLAPAGTTSLPLGNAPATPAEGAGAPPVAMPGPLPCSKGSPPCK